MGDGSAQWPEKPEVEITQSYDGNGQSLKRSQITRINDHDLETGQFIGVEENTQTTYYLRSSVLGGLIVNELKQDYAGVWFKSEGYVYAGGLRIAKQNMPQYEHHNPVTGSWLTTNAASQPYMDRQERDPANGQIPLAAPPSNSTYASLNFASPLFIEGGDPFNFSGGHSIDGMPVSDAEFARRTGNGSATVQQTSLDGTRK